MTTLQESVTFCRLVITRDDNEVLVDVGIDSPPLTPPTLTLLGPTLPLWSSQEANYSPSSAEPKPATSPTSTASRDTGAPPP